MLISDCAGLSGALDGARAFDHGSYREPTDFISMSFPASISSNSPSLGSRSHKYAVHVPWIYVLPTRTIDSPKREDHRSNQLMLVNTSRETPHNTGAFAVLSYFDTKSIEYILRPSHFD